MAALCVYRARYFNTVAGPFVGRLAYTNQSVRTVSERRRLNCSESPRTASFPGKRSRPRVKAARSPARNLPRNTRLIRFPGSSCAPPDVGRIADALDRHLVPADGIQAPDRLLLQRGVIAVRPVRPVVGPQVRPQVLHRVQLRRIRRQQDQAHVARHHQIPAGVPARPIPDQDRMDPRGQLPRELLQEQVDHRGVDLRHDQRRGRPRAGADGHQHVQPLPPILPHRPRPRTPPRPDPRDRPLRAEPRLVLEVGPHLLIRVLLGDGLDLLDDDLLEELLHLGDGILVLRSGHEAAVAEAVHQVIDGLAAQGHAVLLLEDPSQVRDAERADAVLGHRTGLQSLLEPTEFGSREPGWAPGAGSLLEGLDAAIGIYTARTALLATT